MKRISPEYSLPHQKWSRLRNFTRGLDPSEFWACFHLWHVIGNIWNLSFFIVPCQTWRVKNLISNTFSRLNSLMLHAQWPFHLSIFGRTMHDLFAKTIFLKTQVIVIPKARGSLDQNGTISSIWHHSINLISKGQGCFSLTSGLFHQDQIAQVNPAICICNIYDLETSPR